MHLSKSRPAPGTARSADDSVPALVEHIRATIDAAPGQRITFARFMEQALTEPGLGYYATCGMRPTRQGDFLTAPELHPFFGCCIGRLLGEVWRRLEAPPRFTVREWGAGRGTLAQTVAGGLVADGDALAGALVWQPVDIPGRHPASPDTPVVGAIVANEYLDALPVHRLVGRNGHVRERYVTWAGGWFGEVEDEPSDAALVAPLDAAGVSLLDGQVAEVRPAADAWLRQAAARLKAGIILVIDYGHPAPELYGPRRLAGSLATYRDHVAGDDPFAAIGRQDITAHVDISALERTAADAGLQPLGSASQAHFLAGLGLGDLLYQLGRDPATPAAAYVAARASVARLLDPRYLGGFRVLAYGRAMPAGPALRGFELA